LARQVPREAAIPERERSEVNFKTSAILVALAALTTATPARAQNVDTTRAIAFGLMVGSTIPIGSFVHVANSQFNVGGFVDFGRGGGPWAFRLETGYHGFAFKDVISPGNVPTVIKNRYSIVNDNLNALYELPISQSVRAIFTGGPGIYYMKNDPDCVPATGCITDYGKTSGARLGFSFGTGAEFGGGNFSAFVAARWHTVFDAIPRVTCLRQLGCQKTPAHILPINLGFTFRY
jgi:hypothetical protein